ncbi:unnamed protein product [Acanthoscelides obtectus]|uniref:Uncharacterized protein n=1 Tax=Acanthoscelides obtectus TaxID=200917 RepID=A0A9P0M083_ACAOB|nr:unnamed protein product [Acanthoscelides obtectus]CAK1675317.1 hypothetical protein AOBTE_LOCUS30130 [Acanthoscelides obtectus]
MVSLLVNHSPLNVFEHLRRAYQRYSEAEQKFSCLAMVACLMPDRYFKIINSFI